MLASWLHVLPTLPGPSFLEDFPMGQEERPRVPRLLAEHQLTTPLARPGIPYLSSGLKGVESGVLKLRLDCSSLEGNLTVAPQLLDSAGEQRPFLELKTRPNGLEQPGPGVSGPLGQSRDPLMLSARPLCRLPGAGMAGLILQPEGTG